MAVALKSIFPLLIVSALILYEFWASIPSCKTVPSTDIGEASFKDDPDDLKVMIVANLLLLGSESGFLNLYFRDYYMSKFFRKSFEILSPDMLLVLGDVSAKGSELTKSKWVSVLHQFHRILGPFFGLPFHVTLGDRDVGECSELNAKMVNWIASSFPGLDSAGCGAFEISNISFVSLNAVALLCGNNNLRFSAEKVIERESVDLRVESEVEAEMVSESSRIGEMFHDFGGRENYGSSGTGPVLLLHFPLYRTVNGDWRDHDFEGASNPSWLSSNTIESRGPAGTGPYELLHMLPLNATEYIFQALRPRIVFSAHTHQFGDYTHSDGTREVTVPAMTWNARNDPGFVVATFRRNRRAVSISYCTLVGEANVLIAYSSILLLFTSMILVTKTHCLGRRLK